MRGDEDGRAQKPGPQEVVVDITLEITESLDAQVSPVIPRLDIHGCGRRHGEEMHGYQGSQGVPCAEVNQVPFPRLPQDQPLYDPDERHRLGYLLRRVMNPPAGGQHVGGALEGQELVNEGHISISSGGGICSFNCRNRPWAFSLSDGQPSSGDANTAMTQLPS